MKDQDRGEPDDKPSEQQPAVMDMNAQVRSTPVAKPPAQHAQIVYIPVDELRLHEALQTFPRMRDTEWQQFLASVRADGVKDPITVQWGGVVLDGRHRLEGEIECGRPTIPSIVVDLSTEQQLEHIYRSAVLRRHLIDDQRAVLAKDYLELLRQRSLRERARKGGLAGGKGRPRAGNSLGVKSTPELSDSGAGCPGVPTAQPRAGRRRPERLSKQGARRGRTGAG